MSEHIDAAELCLDWDPYLATLDNLSAEYTDPNPDVKHFLTLKVRKFVFDKYGEFEYFVDENGRSAKVLWNGTTQCYMDDYVFLVMDDLDSGFIGIMYFFLNDPEYPQFLGRLNPDCTLYRVAINMMLTAQL